MRKEPLPFRATRLLHLAIFIAASLLAASLVQAQDRRVSSSDELRQALAETTGGVILLAPGDYGALSLQGRHYASTVTLRSEVPRRAVFDEIVLKNSGNLEFDALKIRNKFRADNSANLAILNSRSDNVLYFREVDGVRIDNCIVLGGQYNVLFNTVAHFEIRNSRIGGASEDVMRITGDSYDGLVEGNFFDDVVAYPPTHPDLLQFFAQKGKTPHRITIRRNFMRDLHETGSPTRMAQGVFVSDPGPGGYQDILIEDNTIYTRSPNTIYINGGQKNVIVRNNTLLPSHGGGGAVIRLARKSGKDNSGTLVEDNIAKQVLDETKRSTIGRNYIYGRKANLPALFSGPGKRWQDFLPVLGTGPDKPGMGATDFLRDLLAAQKPGAKGGPRLGPDWSE